ncbi:hypothetical protein MMC14_004002 [Varicellaria rhodocarpa]|nr:hypothetical protein [Varicellaria rhodocarpa]
MTRGSPARQDSVDASTHSKDSGIVADVRMEDVQPDQSQDGTVKFEEGHQQAQSDEATPKTSTFTSAIPTRAPATAVDTKDMRYAKIALSPFLRIDRRLLRHLDTVGSMSNEEYASWRHGVITDIKEIVENESKENEVKESNEVFCCGNPHCFTALIGLNARVERYLPQIRKRLQENPQRDARGRYTEIDEVIGRLGLPKADQLMIFGKLYDGSLITPNTQEELNRPTDHVRSEFVYQRDLGATRSVRPVGTVQEGLRARRDAPRGMVLQLGPLDQRQSRSRSPQATPLTALYDPKQVQHLDSVLQKVASKQKSMIDDDDPDFRLEGIAEGRARKHKISEYDPFVSPSKRLIKSPRLPTRNMERFQAPTSVHFRMVAVELRVPSGWEFDLKDYRRSSWRHLDDRVMYNPPTSENGFYKQRFTVSLPIDWEMYCKQGEKDTTDYPIYCNEGTKTISKTLPNGVTSYSVRTLPR